MRNFAKRINGGWIVTFLYLFACCMPACYSPAGPVLTTEIIRDSVSDQGVYNFKILKGNGRAFFGIVCLCMLPLVLVVPAWWANPLFFWGLAALRSGKNKKAWVLGTLSTAFAISFAIHFDHRPGDFGGFDGGIPGPGFFVWLASILGLVLVGFIRTQRSLIIGRLRSLLRIVPCAGLLVALYATICLHIQHQTYQREQMIALHIGKLEKQFEQDFRLSKTCLESGKVLLNDGDISGAISRFRDAFAISQDSVPGQEAKQLLDKLQ